MLHKVYEIAGVEQDFHKRRLIDSSRILIVGGRPTRQPYFDHTRFYKRPAAVSTHSQPRRCLHIEDFEQKIVEQRAAKCPRE